MTRRASTIPSTYFEDLYRAKIDPWSFRTSQYEQRKFASTVGALTKSAYCSALEVGCSIGVLTGLLAQRCEKVLAVDASQTAIEEARRLNFSNVTFQVRSLPEEFPSGTFDLIVLSEVLYYFIQSDLEKIARSCSDAIAPGGEIILCHWLGETDYPLTGRQASNIFDNAIRRKLLVSTVLRDSIFRLERFSVK